MKKLISHKSLSRIAVPIMLVCAVAVSLWFVSPTPVRALDITVTDPQGNTTLPSGTLGSEYTFKVKIDVQNMDILPIQRVDVQIYNASDSSKKATLQNLPLQTVSKQAHTIAEGSSSGSASVAASTASGWGSANSSDRKGFGYGYSTGFGSINMTSGYGYGYVDNIIYQGTTSITYTIYWTPPSSSTWAGTYKIKPIVYGDDADLNKAFTVPSVSSFTLSAAGGGPGGGWAPAPAATEVEPGVWDISRVITTEGVFTRDVAIDSADAKVKLDIDQDTVGKTKEGDALSQISILEMEDPPAPPEGSNAIGLTYDLDPDDATFDPPITITFTYDPDEIPGDFNEEDLVIAIWDKTVWNEDTGEWGTWVDLEGCTVDPVTHTITAPVSHFTPFAIIARAAPPPEEEVVVPEEEEVVPEEEEVVPEEEEVVPEEEEEVVPEEEEVVPEEEEVVTPKAIRWWLIGVIIASVAVIGGLLAYFLWWRRRI